MKERIIEKIKYIPPYGIISSKESKRFNNNNFIQKDKLYKCRLSKIIIFKGENNSILGIKSFYSNTQKEEISGEEGYDNSNNILEKIIFEIPANDYLCNINIWIGDEYITKIKFGTNKGKEIIVGEGGEDKKISCLNNNKENIILVINGGYKEQLKFLNCKYININDYFGNVNGYFELKMKLKDEKFRKIINSKIEMFKDNDKILLSACLLPDSCFNIVMSFCVY